MKRSVALMAMLLSLFLISCSNHLLTGPDFIDETESNAQEDKEMEFVYDSARNVAVFSERDNIFIDIQDFDEESGKVIKCVEPLFMTILEEGSTPTRSADLSSALRAVFIGYREDGKPGIWLLSRDGRITSPEDGESGRRTSHLKGVVVDPEEAVGADIKGFAGWIYHPQMISDDGLIIAGYGENKKGFSSRFFNIAAGTKVAVFWSLVPTPHGHFLLKNPQVVGTMPEPKENRDLFYKFFYRLFSRFKLFLLDYLDNYLVSVERLSYNDITTRYSMVGLDRDGILSEAEFDILDIYSINPVASENRAPIASFYSYDFLVSGSDLAEVNGEYTFDPSVSSFYVPGYRNSNNIFAYSFRDSSFYWGISGDTNNRTTDSVYYYVPYLFPELNMGPPETGWIRGLASSDISVVTGAPIIGFLEYGRSVRGNYHFSDPDGDLEGKSIYRWYLCATNSDSDEGILIIGADSLTYTFPLGMIETVNGLVNKDGRFLKFEVIPVDVLGNEGMPMKSRATYMPFPGL